MHGRTLPSEAWQLIISTLSYKGVWFPSNWQGSWLKDNQGSCPKPQHQSLAKLHAVSSSWLPGLFSGTEIVSRSTATQLVPCTSTRYRVTCCPCLASKLQLHHQHRGRRKRVCEAMTVGLWRAAAAMPTSPCWHDPEGIHPKVAGAPLRVCPGAPLVSVFLLQPRELGLGK